MPLLILLLLIALPLAEISVFVEVGGRIGAGQTILLTVATAVAGLAIARLQGMAILVRMRESIEQGRPPMADLIHGFFLFLAGVFLFVPGFLTDSLGALLLLPPVRIFLGRLGLQGLLVGRPGPGAPRNRQENVEIDGVFWVEGEKSDLDPPERPGS